MVVARNRLGSLGLIGVGVLITVVGYCLGHYLGRPILDHAKASNEWPFTPGKVLSSSVKHSTSRDHKTHRNKHSYSHHVEYEYSVPNTKDMGKTKYTGQVVWFGDDYSSSSRSTHEAVVKRYPVGVVVAVFYDPDDPSLAVLEPGAKLSSYVLYGIGWAFTLVGVIMVLGGVGGLLRSL